ncbi:unnamed protein product [Durusdinium trenchii]|uniref:diacylglycerol kinase (ATP) n=1 Tax=Durusdinium trenchii TaxID=1381693 RepID=A0ABP0P5J4_9DINO
MLEGDSGNKPGFRKLKEAGRAATGLPVVRAVVGGGDGTVMWADSEGQKHGIDTPKQVAWGIVPLGTGNDFSRVAGWGAPCDDFLMRGTHDLWDRFMGTVQSGPGGNNPEGVDANDFELLKDLVRQWDRAKVRHHDVWEVSVNLDESEGKLFKIGKTQVEEDLNVTSKTFHMVNYFSIGWNLKGTRRSAQPAATVKSFRQESQVGMHFDKHRTKSQTCNLFVYGMAGCLQEMRCWSVQHIGNIVSNLYQGKDKNGTLIMDSEGDLGEPHGLVSTALAQRGTVGPEVNRRPQLIGNPESLMFLNISSYAGGKAHLWQLECDIGVDPPPAETSVNVVQDPGDGKLEVVTLPLIANIAMDKLVHQARKVCSGGPYFLEYFQNDDDVHCFFEVDGEFYHAVNPESTSVYLYKKLQVKEYFKNSQGIRARALRPITLISTMEVQLMDEGNAVAFVWSAWRCPPWLTAPWLTAPDLKLFITCSSRARWCVQHFAGGARQFISRVSSFTADESESRRCGLRSQGQSGRVGKMIAAWHLQKICMICWAQTMGAPKWPWSFL